MSREDVEVAPPPSPRSLKADCLPWPTSGRLTSVGGRSRARPTMSARCKDAKHCSATTKTGSTCSTTSATSRKKFAMRVTIACSPYSASRVERRRAAWELELRYAVVYTVRDGKITRGREYIDRTTALEAAGLRE